MGDRNNVIALGGDPPDRQNHARPIAGGSSIIRLNGKNYSTWKFQIRRVLINRKLSKVVYDASTDLTPIEIEEKDAEASEILSSSLDQNVVNKVLTCNTAREIWDRLKLVYEQEGDANLEATIIQFCTLQMGHSEEMADYIGRMDQLVDKIRSQGENISDRLVRAKLVGGLTSDYDGFRRVWNGTVDKTYKTLIDRLIQDEAEVKASRAQSSSKNSAMYVTSKYNKSPKDKHKMDVSKKDSPCHYCNKKGHWAPDCIKRKKDRQSSSESKVKHEDKKVSFMAITNGITSNNWYADSGASSHMCGQESLFTSLEPFDTPKRIIIGNSSAMQAVAIGSVELKSQLPNGESKIITLKEVLFVPHIAENLVSMGAAAANGVITTFKQHECFMEANGELIAKGAKNKEYGLYLLDFVSENDKVLLSKGRRSLEEWHKCLGHVNQTRIKNIIEKKLVTGAEILNHAEKSNCGDCPRGKGMNAPHPSSSRPRAENVGDIVHVDLVGKLPFSLGKNQYLLLLTDEASNYMVAYPIKTKDVVVDKLEHYFALIECETGRKVRYLWSDCGTEFLNHKVNTLLNIEHATIINSAPRTPQQNGKAERSNRTLIECARTLLVSSGLKEELWAEACVTSAYLLNRTTFANCSEITPFEKWYNRKPNLAHIHEFGREVHILDKARNGSKWSPKTILAYLVGYTDRSNTYRCFVPSENDVKTTCDVIFRDHPRSKQTSSTTDQNEQSVVFDDVITHLIDRQSCDQQLSQNASEHQNIEHPAIDNQNITGVDLDQSIDSPTYSPMSALGDNRHVDSGNNVCNVSNANNDVNLPRIAVPHPQIDHASTSRSNETFTVSPNVTQSKSSDNTWKSTKGGISGFLNLSMYVEPSNYKDALMSDEASNWIDAMKLELNSLEQNHTWVITELPKNEKMISSKWVYKRKNAPGSTTDKFKARLVARGFDQRFGIDFNETFASVATYDSIRLIYALATQFKLNLVQFDVETAFLHGELQENIYLSPPEGVNCPPNHALKLNKSIYGLKQSPRCWKEKLDSIVLACGLLPLRSDNCVYSGKFREQNVILLVYVDDGIVIGESEDVLTELVNTLNKQIKIRIVAPTNFIGFEVVRSDDKEKLLLHQRRYIEKMLLEYNMENCTPTKTPMGDFASLMNESDNDSPTSAPYRQLIGSLLYAACLTRPDIMFSVNLLARFNTAPQERHWSAAKRVLRYLKGTIDFGLAYTASDNFYINCFSDADWAGDVITRQSTSGIALSLGSGPIIFKSKKQGIVALSTTEAEYIAASTAVRDLIWLDKMLGELEITKDKAVVNIDNQSAIKIIKNPELHARTKHLDIRLHHVRDHFKNKLFELKYVPSQDQAADILTKPLPPKIHSEMTNKIGLVSYTTFFSSILMFLCMQMSLCFGAFHVEDPVIWRPTSVSHVEGQHDLTLSLFFHNPCQALFNNLTGVPQIDKTLVDTCSRRFQIDILDSLDELNHLQKKRKVRDITVGGIAAGVAAVTAIYFSMSQTITNRHNANQIFKLEEVTSILDKRISQLQHKVIVSNSRLSTQINSMARDIELLGAVTAAQPPIADALFQTLSLFAEEKRRIQLLRQQLKLGGEVPTILLDMFNMTTIATQATLRHSTVHHCDQANGKLTLVISLLKISSEVDIFKADPFTYQAMENGLICNFKYNGPSYILYNHTSECIKPLMQEELIDDLIISEGCHHRKALPGIKPYESFNCRKMTMENITIPKIQLKHDGHQLKVNCQGRYIMMNHTRISCPNHIIGIEPDMSFQIDGFEYIHHRANVSEMAVKYEIPSRLNLHLGTSRVEFNSLTIEEIQQMQASTANQITIDRVNRLMEESSDWLYFWELIDNTIRITGSYLSIVTFFIITYVWIKARISRCARVAAPTVLTVLLIPCFGLATTNLPSLEMKYTALEATEDIRTLQKDMIAHKCSVWHMNEDHSFWNKDKGMYPISVSCALARMKITCPCAPASEYIPLVDKDDVSAIGNYHNDRCPDSHLSKHYETESETFRIASEYLCVQAPKDVSNWNTDKETYGQLFGAGCALARKAFNCQCRSRHENKGLFRDYLTLKTMELVNDNISNRTQDCERTEDLRKHEQHVNDTSLYAKFFEN